VKKIERHFSSSNYPLNPHLKHLIFDVDNARGSTPLILACENGELDSVKRLIETWGVDVRTPANYYSHLLHRTGKLFEKVTPLFVAAFFGHNQIVRYLLERGADVSVKIPPQKYSTKYDGWTPLYAAISGRKFNKRWPLTPLLEQQEERNVVVKCLLEFGADPMTDSIRPFDGEPIWTEIMCGANAVTALINHGLDLTYRIPFSGETILNYIAGLPYYLTEEDSLAIVKLLVEKGADLLTLDNKRVSPLMKVTDVIDRMDDEKSCLNLTVLDFLLERDEYSPMEKIGAMEFS